MSLATLPHDVLVSVILFLPGGEVFHTLRQVCRELKNVLATPKLLRSVLLKMFPKALYGRYSSVALYPFVYHIYTSQQSALPFWGHRTNGGIQLNSVYNWVNKALIKTSNSTVVFKVPSSPIHFDATLSPDAIEFMLALKKINFFAQLKLQHDNKPLKAISCNQTFIDLIMISERGFTQEEHQLQFEFYQTATLFWDQFKALKTIFDNRDLVDHNCKPMHGNLAILQAVSIVGSPHFNYSPSCLLIQVSVSGQFETREGPRNREHLVDKVKKGEMSEVARTNVYELRDLCSEYDAKQSTVDYCVFKQENEQCHDLLWVSGKLDVKWKIKLRTTELCYCKDVRVNILDKVQNQDQSSPGLGLQYVKFEGYLIKHFLLNK